MVCFIYLSYFFQEDCPICFSTLPLSSGERTYKVCCGKVICIGCIEVLRDNKKAKTNGDLCPFCRVVATDENLVSLVTKRMDLNDCDAFNTMSHIHLTGSYGMVKDEKKAFELLLRAKELGSAEATASIANANAYNHGLFGLEKDVRVGKKFLELAAIGGCIEARYETACRENTKATVSRGVKHFMIAAKAGHEPSLNSMKKAYMQGYATKGEFEQTLRSYQESRAELKSDQRDVAQKIYATIDDEDLFKDPPRPDDCPICGLTLPPGQGQTYSACCGKTVCVCGGCAYAADLEASGKKGGLVWPTCFLCGKPSERSMNEHVNRLKKRMDKYKDSRAFSLMGSHYDHGNMGLPKDQKKAIDLWLKAGELGDSNAFGNVANAYEKGLGVGQSTRKAKHYLTLSAMKGNISSRHNLGCMEQSEGNMDHAVKHWMISAHAGAQKSLKLVRDSFMKGEYVTKDEYEKTVRSYHDSVKSIRSEQRDKADSAREKGMGPSTPVNDPVDDNDQCVLM